MAESYGKNSLPQYFQKFFINLGARFRRIRKRPKGAPAPQIYEYKREKLQELVTQYKNGQIDLFFGDETHICTEGYVPYGWQFPGENISIPSQREKRLNIFGMINYESNYKGFTTTNALTSAEIVNYLDRFSPEIKKDTFLVLDNASIHRSKMMKEMRPIWKKRGLFLFFLPPYSPHLNIAEALWRILKGKWIQPYDYVTAETLFYTANRSLAALGTSSKINFGMAV